MTANDPIVDHWSDLWAQLVDETRDVLDERMDDQTLCVVAALLAIAERLPSPR